MQLTLSHYVTGSPDLEKSGGLNLPVEQDSSPWCRMLRISYPQQMLGGSLQIIRRTTKTPPISNIQERRAVQAVPWRSLEICQTWCLSKSSGTPLRARSRYYGSQKHSVGDLVSKQSIKTTNRELGTGTGRYLPCESKWQEIMKKKRNYERNSKSW